MAVPALIIKGVSKAAVTKLIPVIKTVLSKYGLTATVIGSNVYKDVRNRKKEKDEPNNGKVVVVVNNNTKSNKRYHPVKSNKYSYKIKGGNKR